MGQLEKLKELLNDKEFVDKALKLQSAEEVSDLFAENDVDISPEQLMKVRELLIKRVNGELTDEELEEVAGGELFTGIVIFGLVGLGVITGGGIAAGCIFEGW